MKSKLTILILVVLVGAVSGFAWKMGWIFTSPSSVFRSSVNSANDGNYEAATRNLAPGMRNGLLEDPERMRIWWDSFTRGRTIKSIDYVRDNGRDIQFQIRYQSGVRSTGQATANKIDWRWVHSFPELDPEEQPDSPERNFNPSTISLPKEYTPIKGTSIALRIPEGWNWDKNVGAYKHPVGHFTILVLPSFQDVDLIDGLWKRPENKLSERKDASRDGIKMVYYEGTFKNSDGIRRRVDLIIWDGADPTAIIGMFPDRENLYATYRECILSVQLGAEVKK